MSWKIKRTVFRDYISIIQPEEDWSLFNLTQNIKQKVYGLPRKVFEKKERLVEKPEQASSQIEDPKKTSSQEEEKPKTEEIAPEVVKSPEVKPVPEPIIEETKKQPEKPIERKEEKPIVRKAEIEEESIESKAVDLPQVIMTQSGDTRQESSLVKRKPSIGSDRE